MLGSVNANPLILETQPYEHLTSENNRLESSVDLRIRLKTGTKILKGIQGLLSGFQGKVATSYPEPELRQKSWDHIFKNIFTDIKELQAKITPEAKIKENFIPELYKLNNKSDTLAASLQNELSKTFTLYETQPSASTHPLPSTSLENSIKTYKKICSKEVMSKAAGRIFKLKKKIDFFGETPDCNSPEVKRFAAYVSEFIPDFMVKESINIRGAKNDSARREYEELRNLWVNINCNINQINFNLEKLTTFSKVLSDLRAHTLLLEKNLKSIDQMHQVMNSIQTDIFSKNLTQNKKSENKRDLAPNFNIFNKAVTDLWALGDLNVEQDLKLLKSYRTVNQLLVIGEIEIIERSISNLKIFKRGEIDDSKYDMEILGQREAHTLKMTETRKRIINDWNDFCFNLAKAEFDFDIFDLTINHVAEITYSYLKADNVMQEMRFTRLKNRDRLEHLSALQSHSDTYEGMRKLLLKDPTKQYFKGTRQQTSPVLQIDVLELDEEIAKLKPPVNPRGVAQDNKIDADTNDLINFGFIWDGDETKKELIKKLHELRVESADKLKSIQSKINTAVKTTLPDVFTTAALELNRVSIALEKTNCSQMEGYDTCFNDFYNKENQYVGSMQDMATTGIIVVKKIFSGDQPNERAQHKHIETLPIL